MVLLNKLVVVVVVVVVLKTEEIHLTSNEKKHANLMKGMQTTFWIQIILKALTLSGAILQFDTK